MAIKVLKKGKEPDPTWKVICPHCDSILEYSKNDVIKHESYFFYLHYINCPNCKKDVDVQHW